MPVFPERSILTFCLDSLEPSGLKSTKLIGGLTLGKGLIYWAYIFILANISNSTTSLLQGHSAYLFSAYVACNIYLAYLALIGAHIIVTSISHIAYLNGNSVTFTSHISPNPFACGNKLDCWRLPP